MPAEKWESCTNPCQATCSCKSAIAIPVLHSVPVLDYLYPQKLQPLYYTISTMPPQLFTTRSVT